MWMVRTIVGRWCKGKCKEWWFVQTWLEPSFKAQLPVCPKILSLPPSLSFLSSLPHPTATNWNKIWGANPFQELFPNTLDTRQQLECVGQMSPLERWTEHLAPISTPPWERVGCQLHHMDTCKLSRFFIHLNSIEIQCVLTSHYLLTSFRRSLNLNEHNKIQCRKAKWKKGWETFWKRSVFFVS